MKSTMTAALLVVAITATASAGWVESLEDSRDVAAKKVVSDFKPPKKTNNWLIDFMNKNIADGCQPAMGGYVEKLQIDDVYKEGNGEKSYHGHFKLDNGKKIRFVAAVIDDFDDHILRFITTYDGYWASRGCRFDDIRMYPKRIIENYKPL